MKNKNAKWFVSLVTVFTFLVPLPVAYAALPFTIKSGHPRISLDSTRVTTIQAAANAPIPLNGSAFPQDLGTLMLDIYPLPKTDATDCSSPTNYAAGCWIPVFDNFENGRNHIFLRHQEYLSTNSVLGFQLAFQDKGGTYYTSGSNFTLSRDQWHTLRISWNSLNHTATLQIDSGTPINLYWTHNSSGVPVEWRPDGQKFLLRGRDQIDNVRVYNSETPQASSLVADFGMNEGSGGIAADSSTNNSRLRISTGNTWVMRTSGDYAIQMGSNVGIRVIASSLLTEAWADTYNRALSVANTLKSGGEPLGSGKSVQNAHPNAIIEIAQSLGMAWLVTSDPQFRTAVLIYADRLLAVTPRDIGGDSTQAGRIEAMGIIYDWFFNDVIATYTRSGVLYSSALADAIKETIAFQGPYVCGNGTIMQDAGNWHCSNFSANPEFIGGHSHQNNTEITGALLAIIDEHHELDNLLNTEYENFVNGYNPARAWISVDGGHHMGWAYGAAYTFLDSILLWETGSNLSMREPWQGKLIDREIYGMRGDYAFPASGDAFTYKLSHEFEKSFALWAGKNFDNGYGMYFYNHWALPYGDSIGYSSRLYELLLWEPGLPESPIGSLDYSRWFHNAGQVLMRDTWNYPEATLLEFKSTSFYSLNHHHQDANAFTIFYKAPLAVDSGYYDSYGTTHWHNYFVRSIAHNLITVWDQNETFVRNWTDANGNLVCCSNDGGQLILPSQYVTLPELMPAGSKHIDGVTAYEYTPDYTYTVGNASKAYSASKLDQTNGFIRSMFFLRTPLFWAKPVTIVFDKVTAKPDKATLTKRFLLHTANEPEPLGGVVIAPGQYQMTGNTVTVRNGDGMMFAQTLLPENPVLTKIGGQDASGDYRFMAPDMANQSVYQLRNYPLSSATLSSADMGAWRVEITAPSPSQREYFLHVLSVADNGAVTVPPSAQNLSSSNAAVALLAGTQTIAFSKGDQPATSLSWNTPIANTKILIAGLVPSAVYSGSISTNGSSVSPYTIAFNQDQSGKFLASSQGVLIISSSLTEMSTDLAISLTATPNPVNQGSNITYSATVTNNGPSTASTVTVSSLTGCTLSSSTIPSGGTDGCSVSISATTVGTTTQTVGVSGAEVDPNTANNTASVSVTANPSTDIAVSLSAIPNPDFAGQALSYTATITNNGPSSATGVMLSDALPLGLTLNTITPSQGSCLSSDTINCSLGTLASATSATVSISATPGITGVITNTVSVSGYETDLNSANNSASAVVTVDPAADLAITLIDNPDPVALGQSVTYTTTVTNLGPSPTSGVNATGTLPACNIGTLLSGASQSCTATVTASTMSLPTQSMSVGGIDFDPNALNNATSATTAVAPGTLGTCNGKPVTLQGTSGNDTLTGTAGNDVISGLGGADTIYGLDGNDTICGGNGADKLYGGLGSDTLLGGNGNDTLDGGPGSDTCQGGSNTDSAVNCETVTGVP